ncbi:hypothetical protein HELRODRAFT_162412 [Helobdella robusta]|uniref:Anoctamin n=1 Tax=Helobdella robusta TaxID=6412 RepID=T1ESM2_HELRO|nr:hypothetical protein HELRODRAFT_162412 [Helobdella robusta]ESN98940.1 hypothetical protein HELRODRAFT_162412 [Helobdella robusta]
MAEKLDWLAVVSHYMKNINDDNTKQIDFILTFKNDDDEEARMARQHFFQSLIKYGLICQELFTKDDITFVEIKTPLYLLCSEGNRIGIMLASPVKSSYEDQKSGGYMFKKFFKFKRKFLSEISVDYLSMPIRRETARIWSAIASSSGESAIFRSSQRSLLTYFIMNRVDLFEDDDDDDSKSYLSYVGHHNNNANMTSGMGYYNHANNLSTGRDANDSNNNDNDVGNNEEYNDNNYNVNGNANINASGYEIRSGDDEDAEKMWRSTKGLNHMLLKNYIEDAFPLHEYTYFNGTTSDDRDTDANNSNNAINPQVDDMHEMISPSSSSSSSNPYARSSSKGEWTSAKLELYDRWMKIHKFQPVNGIRNYFGERIALYFAWCDVLIASLLVPMRSGRPRTGTFFLELWKRRNATLAYIWDVYSFEDHEPDRPQHVLSGGKERSLLITYSVSMATILFMVCVVFIITAALILYRVVMTIDFCPNVPSTSCLLVSVIVATILNTIGIMVLNKVYKWVATRLTDWENRRTQTDYDDAIILKLFAFEFANSYTSCFYIAFFRGLKLKDGLFGLGSKYNDNCGESSDVSCMPMLSFQILTLMLMKPLPKFFTDLLLPFLKKHFAKCSNRVSKRSESSNNHAHIEREYHKVPIGDFTTSEYTEKVLLYGYLMLFAASFPLAPLITVFFLIIDTRLDGKRLIKTNRRPVAFISQDIGRWFDILNFINIVGVAVNAFLIAFTSAWANKYSLDTKLIIVLIFENVVYALKYMIAILIPDTPKSIKDAYRKDVFKLEKLISDANKSQAKMMVFININKTYESITSQYIASGYTYGFVRMSKNDFVNHLLRL